MTDSKREIGNNSGGDNSVSAYTSHKKKIKKYQKRIEELVRIILRNYSLSSNRSEASIKEAQDALSEIKTIQYLIFGDDNDSRKKDTGLEAFLERLRNDNRPVHEKLEGGIGYVNKYWNLNPKFDYEILFLAFSWRIILYSDKDDRTCYEHLMPDLTKLELPEQAPEQFKPRSGIRASDFLLAHYGKYLAAGILFRPTLRRLDRKLEAQLTQEFLGRPEDFRKLLPTKSDAVNKRMRDVADGVATPEERKQAVHNATRASKVRAKVPQLE